MTATLFSSRRLRRSAVLGLAVASLVACSDDGDGDDVSGPSQDCIDALNLTGTPFSESDVRAIDIGDRRSGSISTSDVEVDFGGFGVFYYDIYTFNSENGGSVTVEVDPASSFDADLAIYNAAMEELDYQNEGGPGQIEASTGDADADTCYVILVSSSEAEATGSYTLSVED